MMVEIAMRRLRYGFASVGWTQTKGPTLRREATHCIAYHPRRFWWSKRIAGGAVLFLILLAGIVVGTTRATKSRYDSLVETYREAGEPVYVEDFNKTVKIAEDENAATYYTKAEREYDPLAGITSSRQFNNLIQSCLDSGTNAFASEIQSFIDSNGLTLELLRQGGQCERVEWGFTYTRPLFNAFFPSFAPTRNLAKLAAIGAAHSHKSGHDREALSRVISIQRLGDYRCIGAPLLVGHLVAMSILNLPCSVVEFIGHDLKVEPRSGGGTAEEATRQQVHALIDALLDESKLRLSRLHGFAGERALILDSVNEIRSGKGVAWYPAPPLPFSWLLRPVFTEHARQIAELMTETVLAANSETFPEAMRLYPDIETYISRGANKLLPAAILMPSYERTILLDFRLRAQRRMAAITLAIRLFEIDHGARPRALEELVPDYLDSVPCDPFAEGSVAIRYLPAADMPVLYSVGENGIDESGTFELRSDGSVNMDKADLVFFLNGDRPQGR
ncbi:MAG TPA: hypothetical protein PKN33_21165 [Phycisphaerae bacterium]|nr:hypothetical protein [Phycisphaerae bacterium]